MIQNKKIKVMNSDTFNTLKAFIVKQAAVEESEVKKDTEIAEDLGLYGDEAIDFLTSYGRTFNVDLTQFMSADYFSAEGDTILTAIVRFLTNRKKQSRKNLTVWHLEKAIIAGRLDEEIINN